MANLIKLKRRTAGAVGAPASLKSAEPAVNFLDQVLYIGTGDDGSGNATSIVPFAGPGAFVTLGTAQSIGGIKTFAQSPVIPDATAASQAASKGQMDAALAGKAPLDSPALQGAPTAPTPALADTSGRIVTSSWVKGQGYAVAGASLSVFAAPTADVSFGGFRGTNLADPVNPQDAATKAYVDAARQGLDVKESVRVATTANITLSGLLTIDGVTLVAGNRVLVKDQSAGAQNGIYVAASGAWTRAEDAAVSAEVTPGLFTFVEEGTTSGDTGWVLTTNGTVVLGTTALTFAQFSGAGSITTGSGLTRSGNTLSAVGTANRVTVTGSGIDIASTFAGQASITTLGTIATGTWQATAVGLAYGGTGGNLSAIADGTLIRKSGAALAAAVAGTDYLDPSSVIDGGSF